MHLSHARASVAAISLLALAGAAIAGPVAAQDEMSGEGKSLAVITPFYASQPATKEAVDLFIADAEARGYETKMVDTANDNAAVSGEISSAIAQEFDAIILAFAFSQEIGEGLAAAGEAGVPVFGLDAGGVADPMLVNVTTDPGELGSLSAQAIIDSIGGPGTVAMIRLRPVRAGAPPGGHGHGAVRSQRYRASSSTSRVIRPTPPALPRRPCRICWSSTPRVSWMPSGLAGTIPPTAPTRRLRRSADHEVVVTGVDGQDFAIAAVAEGQNWIATVRQDWPAITATLADIVDAHFAGTDPAEQTVFLPAELITVENAQ